MMRTLPIAAIVILLASGGLVSCSHRGAEVSAAGQSAPDEQPPKEAEAPQQKKAEAIPPGAESPKSLVERMMLGMAEGDPHKVESAYDQSTEAGKLEAEMMKRIAIAPALYRQARDAAQQKFGEAGVNVINEEWSFGLTEEFIDPKKMRELLDKELEIFRGDEGTAIARIGEKKYDMQEKDGRWYLAPENKEKLAFAAFSLGIAHKFMIEPFENAPQLVAESDSPEQLRQKLQEAAPEPLKSKGVQVLEVDVEEEAPAEP